ncbi:MAG: SMC-Scp complex subunit ScpB [Bacilli bacterium]
MSEAIIEGLLFLSGSDGININEVSSIYDIKTTDIEFYLSSILEKCKKENRGITIKKLGNNYKFTTKDIHKNFYEHYFEKETKKLTDATMEVLAIIAYNEPITKSQVSNIRGIESSHLVRRLSVNGLVKEFKKADLPGKPVLYITTDKFLDYFGINSKADLPKIELEISNINKEEELFISKEINLKT